MAIHDFFVSRNNAVSNSAAYIGHPGRLFYDSNNGVIKISDGVTPGGVFIPYNIATTTTVGGIKAGPGANVSTDGTLTINTAGLPLSFGDFTANVNQLQMVNANQDMILVTNGTGNIRLVGNIQMFTTSQDYTNGDTPIISVQNTGQVRINVPVFDSILGAVEIVGSSTGNILAPMNSGVMTHITGQPGIPNRNYYDGNGNYSILVGRRWNGNIASMTQVLAGQDFFRIGGVGYNGNNMPTLGPVRINFTASENQTPTAQGGRIEFFTTANGAVAVDSVQRTAYIDPESGVWATKSYIQGNLTVGGNAAVTGQVSALNYRGTSRNAGTLGAGGTLTIDYATDHHVFVNITGAITIAHTNIAVGRNVKVIIVNGTGNNYAVNTGVPDLNATGGSATSNLNSNRMGMYEFVSFGTTTASLYASVNK